MRAVLRGLGAAFVAVVLALPHIGQLWRPGATARFLDAHPPCPPPWQAGVAAWHACHNRDLWRLTVHGRPLLAYSVEGVATVGGAITTLAVALVLLGCLILLREGLPEPPRSR